MGFILPEINQMCIRDRLLSEEKNLEDRLNEREKLSYFESKITRYEEIEGYVEAATFLKNKGFKMCIRDRSNDYSKLKFIKKAIRKINRNIHSGYLYYFINKDSICYNKNFILYSVPVLKNNKLHEVEKFIDIVSRTKKEATVIFMFHSILKEGSMYYEDLFSWDYKDFYDLCVFSVSYTHLDVYKRQDFHIPHLNTLYLYSIS